MTLSSRKLLVVDDDPDFADSLADLLGLSGYQVDVVHSGEDAIRRCRETHFDLALMDVRMPGKNGVESFLEIRKSQPEFRAVLMTAHAAPELLASAVHQGVRATVRKPLSIDHVMGLIEQHRQRRLLLVIDDDSDFAQSLALTLHDAGYCVAVATDGDAALELVAQDHPAAIVLDLRLSQSSGLEVFEELNRRNLQTPTVVISAYLSEEQDSVRALQKHHVAGLLEKPFPADALLTLLSSIPTSR